MGMHEGVYGFGMLLGPMIGGAVAESYGPAFLYRMLAAIAMIMPLLALRLDRDKRRITN